MNFPAYCWTLLGALLMALIMPLVVELNYEYGVAATSIFLMSWLSLTVIGLVLWFLKKVLT